MPSLVLYGLEPSPPVRAVKLTLHALELPYEFKLVNLLAGEHKTKQFLAMNPQHTVPVLEDDGQYLWDSHAISTYLVRKYGKHDSLYPNDLLDRALVDQRLHFDSGVLFQGCLRNIAIPVFYENNTVVPREKIDGIYEAYGFLEAFLKDRTYLCGATMTIADFCCVATVSSLVGLAPIDPKKYPNLAAWLARLETLPYYKKANGYGAQMLIDNFKAKITGIA